MLKIGTKVFLAAFFSTVLFGFTTSSSLSHNFDEDLSFIIDDTVGDLAIDCFGPKIGIKISGKPHRKTTNRRRDGVNCGCDQCFGLCDVSVGLDAGYSFDVVVPANSTVGTIYFPETIDHAESEFGIDEDLSISGGALQAQGVSSLTFLTGLYEYHSETVTYEFDGESHTSFGYVTVNVALN